MTIWLKQRLGIWLGASLLGGAFLWNVSATRAQSGNDFSTLADGKPRLKFTKDQAIRVYTHHLRFIMGEVEFKREDVQPSLSSVSSKSRLSPDFNAIPLEQAIAQQWSKNKRPFVMVNEGGYWGVDLVETYAKSNNLQGVAKAKAIFKLTGAVLDDLPRDEAFKREFCQRRLGQIALSMRVYQQDYDLKYPPAKDWIESLQAYRPGEASFTCPAIPKNQHYGYAYNAKTSGQIEPDYSTASKTISLYETSILKRSAYGTGQNLAFRHQNGANYAFVDGHVKWFPKAKTQSFDLKLTTDHR